MTYTIESLDALEILDSRGRPTVRATCTLAGGIRAAASAPSGASTGSAEALELRDGDARRYGGLGCRRAVTHVRRDIHDAMAGRTFSGQAELDAALCALDGTPNKSRLGANALLAVSLAFARAAAQAERIPLYDYFAGLIGARAHTLPRPTINLFSGGKHAGVRASMQDILIVPAAAHSIDEALAVTYGVYQAAAALVLRKYDMRLLRADEGGQRAPRGADAEAARGQIGAELRAAAGGVVDDLPRRQLEGRGIGPVGKAGARRRPELAPEVAEQVRPSRPDQGRATERGRRHPHVETGKRHGLPRRHRLGAIDAVGPERIRQSGADRIAVRPRPVELADKDRPRHRD